MRDEMVIQGLKLDHIIKKSKTSLDYAKKGKEILIQTAEKQMKRSAFFKYVVMMSLFLITVFILSCIFG